MVTEMSILMITAASLGFFHTLFGPDHYLPFIALSKARNWSTFKTIMLTLLCGIGHILSSVLLGIIGIIFGIGISKLEFFESFRGNLAAYAFVLFGIMYLIWAFYKFFNSSHKHRHHDLHKKKNLTPWTLFIIFALGPCEPLIPILMYPAIQSSVLGLIAVVSVFAITTLATMIAMVFVLTYGTSFLKLEFLHKYTHIIAGFTILLSGGLILLGF